eukprot:scaffold33_cov147-Skeletonema_menzelii.AAC.9
MDACEYDSSEMPPSLTSKQRLRRWKIPQSKSFSCCGHLSDKSSIRQDCSHFVVSPSGKAFSCSSSRYDLCMPRSRSICGRLSCPLKLCAAESIFLKARPTGGLIGWKLTNIEACKDNRTH